MQTDTITVVVPTFKRTQGLARVLAALSRQCDPGVPWDVLIVDNDDAPGALPTFEQLRGVVPVPARFVREPVRGAAHARNRGVAEAGGTIVVFIDDDVEPADDWLARLTEPVLAGRCEGVGGKVVLDPAVPRPRWFVEAWMGGYLAAFDRGPTEVPIAADDFVITASAAFRADAIHAAGGFDPELGPRSGVQLVNDDISLCRRVTAAGGRIHYVSSATVVHELPPHRLRRRFLISRSYCQGRSDWLLERTEFEAHPVVAALKALRWLALVLLGYIRQGLWRPPVAFRAVCDVARAAGRVRESARVLAGGPALAPAPEPTPLR
jgi:GT2 family glycosyltransferase